MTKWYPHHRYRKARIGWFGEAYLVPDWASRNLDDVKIRRLWSGWRLSKKSIRGRIAKALWNSKDRNAWVYR